MAAERSTSAARREPPAVGGRLQALRKARRLTLERLAEASGVSKSMLSQIERGKVNPTVATLWNLTRALGVEIAELLEGPGPAAADGPAAPALEHLSAHATPAITSADGRCRLKILNPPRRALSLEWYEVTVAPGGALKSAPHAAGAEEHLTVLEGELRVDLPGGRQDLKAGETLRYRADQPHGIVNAAGGEARALLVVEFR